MPDCRRFTFVFCLLCSVFFYFATENTEGVERLHRGRLKNALWVKAASILDANICGQFFGFDPRLAITSGR